MAVKQIGVTTGGNKKEYQALTTDNPNTYPTDCGPGSTMVLIDPSTHRVTGGLYFDGTNWNTV
jgi:hypothetical protein